MKCIFEIRKSLYKYAYNRLERVEEKSEPKERVIEIIQMEAQENKTKQSLRDLWYKT